MYPNEHPNKAAGYRQYTEVKIMLKTTTKTESNVKKDDQGNYLFPGGILITKAEIEAKLQAFPLEQQRLLSSSLRRDIHETLAEKLYNIRVDKETTKLYEHDVMIKYEEKVDGEAKKTLSEMFASKRLIFYNRMSRKIMPNIPTGLSWLEIRRVSVLKFTPPGDNSAAASCVLMKGTVTAVWLR